VTALNFRGVEAISAVVPAVLASLIARAPSSPTR
jgi:hypothetical protein